MTATGKSAFTDDLPELGIEMGKIRVLYITNCIGTEPGRIQYKPAHIQFKKLYMSCGMAAALDAPAYLSVSITPSFNILFRIVDFPTPDFPQRLFGTL